MVRLTSVSMGLIFMATITLFAAGTVLADTGIDLDGVQTPPTEFAGAFFAGGGPSYGLAFFDFEELNEALPGVEFTGDLAFGDRSAFFIRGGGGFGASDLRFGGRSAGGSWTVPVGSGQFDRAELKVDYGGFFFEVLLGGRFRLPFYAGLLIGGLDLELRLMREPVPDFAGAISAPFLAELKRSYFLLEPYLSTELRLLEFMGLKLGVGYLMAFSNREWYTPFKEELSDGPLRALFAPALEVMIIFGG